jgi:hypothetical protein
MDKVINYIFLDIKGSLSHVILVLYFLQKKNMSIIFYHVSPFLGN